MTSTSPVFEAKKTQQRIDNLLVLTIHSILNARIFICLLLLHYLFQSIHLTAYALHSDQEIITVG